MNIAKVTIVFIVLLACTLSGCSTMRYAEVEPGEYVVICGGGEANEVAMRAIQKIGIDRDERVATFTLADGSQIVTPFVPRDRANWPAGCPTNIGSTCMEVLDITEDTLTIETITFNNPILVRSCPPSPTRVVLRENGEIGGGGGACTRFNECIFFAPQQDRPWTVNDSTASTDEDTSIIIEIITGDDEASGDIDPSTFTITSDPANGTIVNNYDGIVTYTPNTGFNGSDFFTYRICDIYGYWDTATVTLTVNLVDDQQTPSAERGTANGRHR